MSSFEKTVKLACKPKNAPPKAKYMDPIIAATYSEDGAVHDVCRALAPRIREPNAVVVFKALIVLHTMIRNGATDNVLSYLSSDDVLKLRNVSNGQWEGYHAPKNLQNYAAYLDSRIRAYKDLKHDPVRVQSESNRDTRVESSIEQVRGANGAPQRSKTIAGRKLRAMTVEKGLLRETKAVQRTVSALLECRFYLDNLDDELNVTALRMLVKDLLVLSQALNEGIINVLENYFEMSRVDAEEALKIYRNFCKQNDRIIEYLGVAKKLQNLLNVQIPNFKHPPVSLATALEEYLNDPNFEQNRIEYKTQKALADKGQANGTKFTSKASDTKPSTSNQSSKPEASSSSAQPKTSNPSSTVNQAVVDFFSSIEEETGATQSPQPTAAFPAAPFLQPQHTAFNPFAARQSMLFTGALPQQPFAAPQLPQQTGFVQPQATGFPLAQPTAFSPPQQQQPVFQQPFLQPQQTGFLQPQTTGSNPFRQSMMIPQMTGMPAFGSGPFQTSGAPFASPAPASNPSQNFFGQQNNAAGSVNGASGFPQINNAANAPQRPSSTPITSNTGKSFGQAMQPVVSHQTGSRNPFGVPQQPAPPVPKAPTLQELATGAFGGSNSFLQQHQQQQQSQQQTPTQSQQQAPNPNPNTSTFTSSSANSSMSKPLDGASMSSVASSFTFNNKWGLDSSKPGETQSQTTGTPSLSSQPTSSSLFSSQITGSSNATSAPSISPLQPQSTGFGGIKPFKPSSSFGAALLESLPPLPEVDTPGASATSSTSSPLSHQTGGTGLPSLSSSSTLFKSSLSPTATTNTSTQPLGALNSQATGMGPLSTGLGNTTFNSTSSGLSGGLRPQMTGGGVANPFRASMFGGSPLGATSFTSPPLPSTTTGAFPGASSLGSSLFQSNLGSTQTSNSSQNQQNGVASLI